MVEFTSVHGEFVDDDIAINFLDDKLISNYCGAFFVISGYTISLINMQGTIICLILIVAMKEVGLLLMVRLYNGLE